MAPSLRTSLEPADGSYLSVGALDEAAQGHRTLAEKAFETLHAAIITGRLRPGTRLPIEELAQLLQMSPMPIREAVRRLDAAGLVDAVENDPTSLGVHLGDFPALAVVDCCVAVVDAGDEEIAGGKWGAADHDLLGAEPPFGLDQLARRRVQALNLDVSLRHHQRVLALGEGLPPVTDHRCALQLGGLGDRHPLGLPVEAQCLSRVTLADQLRRIAVNLVEVADHFVQVDGVGSLRDRGEQAARLDRAKLLGVSDQDELCASLIRMGDQAGKLL